MQRSPHGVHSLYLVARIMMPECDWSWLKKIKTRLYAAAPTSGATGPVITSMQLLDIGQALMDENMPRAGESIRLANAVRYRDGFMIAFLAFIPPRRKNLAALEIGRHLVREGDGWFVIIPRGETKTRTPIEFRVPELLESYLDFYLDVVRPRLLRHPTCNARLAEPLRRARLAALGHIGDHRCGGGADPRQGAEKHWPARFIACCRAPNGSRAECRSCAAAKRRHLGGARWRRARP
jgi:hypothetical protein